MSGNRIAIDTNALSALFGNDTNAKAVVDGYARPAIPVIVIGEFRFGILKSRKARQNAELLEAVIAKADILHADIETATIYASIRLGVEKIGRPIPQNDLWIAAIAIRHNLPLLSNDAHFTVIEGLDLKKW